MKPLAKLIPVLLNNDSSSEIPSIEEFNAWVEAVIECHGHFIQISIQIVDENTSQELNKTYRNKDKPTNVLSFALDLPEVVEEDLIGDLAICAEIVKQEAIAQNKPENHHWAHMTIHGTLHLLGFDHIDDKDAEIMEVLEIKLLKQLNIANPYEYTSED
ncbi:MAG: rRNA maturation RNase YbeY [Alcanivoracaceae bacterium]|nr:rRNA maturation RNase YbeY [Alcanivoracaceae bacterium]